MEKSKDRRQGPRVVARHRSAAKENIQKPMLFNTPGRQVGCPTVGPLNLDLDVGERKREKGSHCSQQGAMNPGKYPRFHARA